MFGAVLEVEMLKKCTPLWREAGFGANMLKPTHVRTISGGCDIKKVHAVFARSTLRSKNAKKKTDHVRTTFGRSTAPHYTITTTTTTTVTTTTMTTATTTTTTTRHHT